MAVMLRLSLSFATGLGLLVSLTGCSHLTETRVITAFHKSLEDHDLDRLRAETSDSFESRAIKGADTFEALDLIEFPEGKIKVVKVVDTKKSDKDKPIEKKVTIEVGTEKTRVVVYLKKDGDKGRWVVDDEFLRREDIEKNRSLATRLELLVNVNRALQAWKAGEREGMGAVSTPEFSQALANLPANHFPQLAEKLTSSIAPQPRVMLDGTIGEETAKARIPRSDGELTLSFRRVDGRWLLDDAMLETRKGNADITSVRDMTAALGSALWFLECYRNQNKEKLAEICTSQFYRGSLESGDLTQVPLPEGPSSIGDLDVTLRDTAAAIILNRGDDMVRISMQRTAERTIHDTPTYLVDEVTIYELHSRQDKRLSSLYNSRKALEQFSKSLANRDMPGLLTSSTHDFKDRVWQAASAEHFAWLPLDELSADEPKILQTMFKGPLTEILVEVGDNPMTYVLRDEDGKMRVDDILVPATNAPQSMKSTLETLIPVANFAMALRAGDMTRLRGAATADFTKSVWMHLDAVPQFDPAPEDYLQDKVSAVSIQGDNALVVLGSDRRGAQVRLSRERGRFRVEDMTLVAGVTADDRIALKRTIRTQLAEGRYTIAEPTEVIAVDETSDLEDAFP